MISRHHSDVLKRKFSTRKIESGKGTLNCGVCFARPFGRDLRRGKQQPPRIRFRELEPKRCVWPPACRVELRYERSTLADHRVAEALFYHNVLSHGSTPLVWSVIAA